MQRLGKDSAANLDFQSLFEFLIQDMSGKLVFSQLLQTRQGSCRQAQGRPSQRPRLVQFPRSASVRGVSLIESLDPCKVIAFVHHRNIASVLVRCHRCLQTIRSQLGSCNVHLPQDTIKGDTMGFAYMCTQILIEEVYLSIEPPSLFKNKSNFPNAGRMFQILMGSWLKISHVKFREIPLNTVNTNSWVWNFVKFCEI